MINAVLSSDCPHVTRSLATFLSEGEGRCGTSSSHPLVEAENSLVPTSTKQYNASPATQPAVAWFRGRLLCEPAT